MVRSALFHDFHVNFAIFLRGLQHWDEKVATCLTISLAFISFPGCRSDHRICHGIYGIRMNSTTVGNTTIQSIKCHKTNLWRLNLAVTSPPVSKREPAFTPFPKPSFTWNSTNQRNEQNNLRPKTTLHQKNQVRHSIHCKHHPTSAPKIPQPQPQTT